MKAKTEDNKKLTLNSTIQVELQPEKNKREEKSKV